MDLRLAEYSQHVTTTGSGNTYTSLTFNNADPLLVRTNKPVCVLRQSGRAVVWFGKMTAPGPLVPTAPLLEQPKVEYHRVPGKPWQRETVWEYVMAVDATFLSTFDPIAAEAWPASPAITAL